MTPAHGTTLLPLRRALVALVIVLLGTALSVTRVARPHSSSFGPGVQSVKKAPGAEDARVHRRPALRRLTAAQAPPPSPRRASRSFAELRAGRLWASRALARSAARLEQRRLRALPLSSVHLRIRRHVPRMTGDEDGASGSSAAV